MQSTLTIAALTVGAAALSLVAPTAFNEYFPKKPWVAFHDSDVMPAENGYRVAYQFTKSKDCTADAFWYYVDGSGADFKIGRGDAPASMNDRDTSDDLQVLSVVVDIPESIKGTVGYKVTLRPRDPSCGPVAHAGIAWLRVDG